MEDINDWRKTAEYVWYYASRKNEVPRKKVDPNDTFLYRLRLFQNIMPW